jgi:hypothetical protein
MKELISAAAKRSFNKAFCSNPLPKIGYPDQDLVYFSRNTLDECGLPSGNRHAPPNPPCHPHLITLIMLVYVGGHFVTSFDTYLLHTADSLLQS